VGVTAVAAIPATMRHIAVEEPGPPDVLVLATGPVPAVPDDGVLIKVVAAGVNRPDVSQRRGTYPPPPGASPILGLEVAGHIVVRGPHAGPWQVGDAVCALVAGGGYAEYCAAPASQCLPVPAGLSMVEAAAVPETYFTVWTNVFQRGRLAAGETILIHGGTGGIGTTAIQLARAFGARVFTTAGSDAKCDVARALGAEVAINYHEQDFVDEVRSHTGGAGVNVILDIVGGPYLARNIASLAMEGRLVQIAFLEGSRVEVNLDRLMRKRLTLTGSTLRPRSSSEKGAIARELYERVWPLLAEGRVRPVIDRTFPLAEAVAAHARIESSAHVGKIVLAM
jgi:putative PIG3 family NAD(P)H quinone oxidoreductase